MFGEWKLRFCGSLGSLCGRAALLLEDLIENDRERRDGSEERAKNLRDECVLGGQFAEGHEFCNGQNLAFYHAALDLNDVLVLLCELANDTRGRNRVLRGVCHGRGAVEQLIELGVAGLVGGEAGERVLDNGIVHARLAHPGLCARRPAADRHPLLRGRHAGGGHGRARHPLHDAHSKGAL